MRRLVVIGGVCVASCGSFGWLGAAVHHQPVRAFRRQASQRSRQTGSRHRPDVGGSQHNPSAAPGCPAAASSVFRWQCRSPASAAARSQCPAHLPPPGASRRSDQISGGEVRQGVGALPPRASSPNLRRVFRLQAAYVPRCRLVSGSADARTALGS